ncbi:Structural maintenance of chromosomes protein 6 [Kalmusia sp. IMI 367209]|nr:Structural maintenance of chromosomes protein 6 [Kalmusia sp. IMI 367209]
MQPIIATKGKTTHLRYELPHRAHASAIYPVKAPNGSTIILYGHENGVGILWRGGRPLKKSAPASKVPTKPPPKVNGTKDAIMIIDSDDDEPAKSGSQPPPKAEFEKEEEELDPDLSYPSIVQQIRLPLNTEVLHIAVPQVPVASELRPSETVPPIFNQKMVFVVSCADFTVRIITLPLNPPPDAAKERPSNIKSLFGEEIVKIPTYAGHQTIPSGVSITWTSEAEPRQGQPSGSGDEMEVDGEEDSATAPGRRSPRKKQPRRRSVAGQDTQGFDLLVASHSGELGGLLKIWRFSLTETSVKTTNPISAYQALTLQEPASKIAFNTAQYPKRRHSQLLVADSAGIARIYDPFAPRKRGSSTGAFVALFRTRFENIKSGAVSPPVLATRKPIIDAAWVSEGRSILALLADGEWGVWDVEHTDPNPPADPSSFSLRSFVGTSESDKASSGASSPKSRSGRNSLVPMTPNTRRRKEETLFHGNSSSAIPIRGGVSVASLASSNGAAAEDSVVIWYGKEVYRLPDLAKFRARSASSNARNSLQGPGLSQIHDIPLLGESIVSVSQFDTTTRDARMAVPREVLLASDHRLIIGTATAEPADRDATSFSANENAEEEDTRRTDQALLARGELDLGGMNRLLEGMGGSGSLTLGNPRKRAERVSYPLDIHDSTTIPPTRPAVCTVSMAQVLPAKRSHGLIDRHRAALDDTAGPSRESKRARHSIEPTVEPSEESYSQDANSDPPEDDILPTPAELEEDDEAAYMQATQMVGKRLHKTKHDRNEPAEAGVIEEIKCTNFMCHEQLTVPLGPLINFIIGHNGSGKSAVLTALTLCLGGKATATNRGQSLKSFIKEGRESSVLSVKIKNQGSGAYKPELYGDSVIVERHFNRAGTSGFKLKDRNNKLVSTKRAELEDIIDWFSLQIDNPLNVLTQDMARQFLNDSNPKEKYKFFLKGTQLETLDRDYSQIHQELEEQAAKSQTLRNDVDALRKQYEKAKQKLRAADVLRKMRDAERQLEHQAAWAEVASYERDLAEADTQITKLADLIDERKTTADTASEEYARADGALHSATTQAQECQAELQPAQDDKTEAQAKVEEANRKLMNFKTDERKMQGAINSSKKSIENTQSQIQEHRDRQIQANNGLHAQRVHELEEARLAYEERKESWEAHDQALPALNNALQEARERKQRSITLMESKRSEESQSKTTIRSLEQGQRKWSEPYRNAPLLERLVLAIEQESKFRDRPVGPMGRYVELKKPEWSHILEKSFGAALNGFVVTNKTDQDMLSSMMKRMNYNAPIYIGPKERIDTSSNEPDEQLLTWERALNISNDLVRNQLIINQRIEQVVLIPNRKDASDFAHNGGTRRKNVKVVFCRSDISRRLGHSFTFNDSGGVNLGPIDEYKGMPRMQADKGPQIQDEKENLTRIQREMRDLAVEIQAAQEHLNACQVKFRDHKTKKASLKQQMDRAHDDVDRLDEEVALLVPDTAQVEQLEKELEELEEQKRLDEEQFQDLTIMYDEAKSTLRAHKNDLNAATKAAEELQMKLEKYNNKVHTLTQKREQVLRAKNVALEQVQEAEEHKSNWEQRRDELQTRLDLDIEDAQKICPRVDVPEGATFESLKQKLDTKRQQRELHEKQLGGSQEELQAKSLEAKRAWFQANQHFTSTQTLRNALAHALDNRKIRWLHFRRHIALNARVTFGYLLAERQFRGSLAIDHNKKALEIHVQPDITVAGNAERQTKTLSGGEKSFSTTCLLLALWDAMGSPIRCLDEFDVFMDNVNREITMEMIIGAARRSHGRQYILITPQAMNNKKVHSMDDVKIIRMTDPERGQTALSFRQ